MNNINQLVVQLIVKMVAIQAKIFQIYKRCNQVKIKIGNVNKSIIKEEDNIINQMKILVSLEACKVKAALCNKMIPLMKATWKIRVSLVALAWDQDLINLPINMHPSRLLIQVVAKSDIAITLTNIVNRNNHRSWI